MTNREGPIGLANKHISSSYFNLAGKTFIYYFILEPYKMF